MAHTDIKRRYVEFYKELYAAQSRSTDLDPEKVNQLISKRLTDQQRLMLSMEVSDQEIKDAVFSFGKNKAPGPDGYTVEFFTSC